jgi:hypothetical protein
MAALGAVQKLTLEIGCFRFCPEAVIQASLTRPLRNEVLALLITLLLVAMPLSLLASMTAAVTINAIRPRMMAPAHLNMWQLECAQSSRLLRETANNDGVGDGLASDA